MGFVDSGFSVFITQLPHHLVCMFTSVTLKIILLPLFCVCVLICAASLASAVPTSVGFTGQANLIVTTSNDFFIAALQNRHSLQPTMPDVIQVVSFGFRSTSVTAEAVLLSAAAVQGNDNSLKVFWVSLQLCHSSCDNTLPYSSVTIL